MTDRPTTRRSLPPGRADAPPQEAQRERWGMKMNTKKTILVFLVGAVAASAVWVSLGLYSAKHNRKLGFLHGQKEGKISVINFLAKHFPKPDGSPVEPGHHFGLKWYGINVIETNGIKTLRVKNEM